MDCAFILTDRLIVAIIREYSFLKFDWNGGLSSGEPTA